LAASERGNERLRDAACTPPHPSAKFVARYLTLLVVLDGMIISATCLSLGLISRTSSFASLVYS
jgi:hypothetical protein